MDIYKQYKQYENGIILKQFQMVLFFGIYG